MRKPILALLLFSICTSLYSQDEKIDPVMIEKIRNEGLKNSKVIDVLPVNCRRRWELSSRLKRILLYDYFDSPVLLPTLCSIVGSNWLAHAIANRFHSITRHTFR